MIPAMPEQPRRPSPFHLDGSPRVELVLRDADGVAWPLTLSAGMEKFVGLYPRVDGFDTGGPLIVFRAAGLPA